MLVLGFGLFLQIESIHVAVGPEMKFQADDVSYIALTLPAVTFLLPWVRAGFRRVSTKNTLEINLNAASHHWILEKAFQ